MDFAELCKLMEKAKFKEKLNSQKRFPSPGQPRSQAERAAHGTEYSHRPAWLSAWLCSLPAPAHLLTSWAWETG